MYSNPKVYWVTWLFIVAYVALAAVFFSVFIQNNSPIYTWFANLGAPGSALVSYRNTFVAISVRLAIIAHTMIIPFLMGMIYTRATRAAAITFFALILVLVIFTLLSVAGTGSAYGSCNVAFGNLCNSLDFCCVNVGVPGCNNPLPCPGILPSDLTPNIEFLGLFWMNFVLFLMQLAFVITTIFLYVQDEETPPPPPPPAAEEEPEQKEEQIPLIPPPPITMSVNASLHGLKKRTK